jgi:adenylosuccinate lyase
MKKILFSGKVTFESGEGEVMISRHMDVMKNEIKSIHNAVKAEKFVVKSMERDMKRVRHDLKALSTLMRRSDDESIYSEDVSDNVSDSSSGV